MTTQIRQFLKTTFPKNFIYYNNKASIKICTHKQNEAPILEYLNNNKVSFTVEYPQYIMHKFYLHSNYITIRIKK
jgi:hypothetical protein